MQRLAQGDESVREDLIVHNLRLVVYIARKFENSGAGIEDLISIGRLGSLKRSIPFALHGISSWQPTLRAALKMRY